ncbi:hypothetical protein LINPERHAP1_LOCUS22863, partial [Linum perenne]
MFELPTQEATQGEGAEHLEADELWSKAAASCTATASLKGLLELAHTEWCNREEILKKLRKESDVWRARHAYLEEKLVETEAAEENRRVHRAVGGSR